MHSFSVQPSLLRESDETFRHLPGYVTVGQRLNIACVDSFPEHSGPHSMVLITAVFGGGRPGWG